MKRLTCEMCGGTDLIKQDGVFVCQSCGLKYSIEEMKKLMIEGTVEVQGTVKVDNTDNIQKYLSNARRAKEKEDWEETEKYYNMVEQNDPDNIEAIFYSAYGKAKATLVDSDIYKRQAAFKVLSNCISVIDDHYQIDRREENKTAISQMANDLVKMIKSSFVFTEWKDGYGRVVKTDKIETYRLFMDLVNNFQDSINNIQKVDDKPYLHETLIKLYTDINGTDMANMKDMFGANFFAPRIKLGLEDERRKLKNIKTKMYWDEHAVEKRALEDEKRTLSLSLTSKKTEIRSVPEAKTYEELNKKISDLYSERNSLGLFKVKEKNALMTQIEELESQAGSAKKAKDDAVATIEKEVKRIEARIRQIDTILTAAR